jgi:hypothetical protein
MYFLPPMSKFLKEPVLKLPQSMRFSQGVYVKILRQNIWIGYQNAWNRTGLNKPNLRVRGVNVIGLCVAKQGTETKNTV